MILSQGGQALRTGARYAMVTMGSELKDPQTGQSLGRIESPCCQLVIDRVTPNLSYGHLEGAGAPLDNLLPGALQVREQVKGGAKPAAEIATAGATPATSGAPSRKSRRAAHEGAAPAAPEAKKDDKW